MSETSDDRLLSEEQAAAATLSSLMPYVSSSTSSSSQPSWPPAQPGMLAALHQNMSSSGPLLLVETTPTLVSSAQQSLQNGPLEDTPVHVMFSPLSVAESSRHNSLQSLILTLVNNKLDQSLPFSQQQQHVLSEVLHIVRQNYPEYGEESVRGLIAAQLKISQEHKLTPKRGITNGNGGRSDTEIVTLRTVPVSQPEQSTSTEEPPPKVPKAEIPPMLQLTPSKPSATDSVYGVWSHGYGPSSLAPPSPRDLNTKEVSALRQLIKSYRESAGFLLRAAEQLESTLPKQEQ